MAIGKCCKALIVLLVIAVVVIIVGVIGASFSNVEFYQYGFKKHKTKGTVDRTKVFGAGLYFNGPEHSFVTMPASAQLVDFDEVLVFTKDRLEIELTAHMQYFLRKDQMNFLHKKYDVAFDAIIKTNALAALKNKAPNFEIREFMRNRTFVEEELFLAIREHISGSCCEVDCELTGSCIRGCKRQSECVESDYGFFVDARYFQLDALDLPDGLKSKFLKTQVLYEEASLEHYKQESNIIRKETDSIVKEIEYKAKEIRWNARSESTLIKGRASANATAQLDTARSAGMKRLYNEIGITDPKQKASFEYMRTLAMDNQVRLAVNFNYLAGVSFKELY